MKYDHIKSLFYKFLKAHVYSQEYYTIKDFEKWASKQSKENIKFPSKSWYTQHSVIKLLSCRNNKLHVKKIRHIICNFSYAELVYYFIQAYMKMIGSKSFLQKIIREKKFDNFYKPFICYIKNGTENNKSFLYEDLVIEMHKLKNEEDLYKNYTSKEKCRALFKYVECCKTQKNNPEFIENYSIWDYNSSNEHFNIWFNRNGFIGIWNQFSIRTKQLIKAYSEYYRSFFRFYTFNDLEDNDKFKNLFFRLNGKIKNTDYLYNKNICWDNSAQLMFDFCFGKLNIFSNKHGRAPVDPQECVQYFLNENARYYMSNIKLLHSNFKINKESEKKYKKFISQYLSKFQSKNEKRIAYILFNFGFIVTSQKKFVDCKNKNPLPFDIYSDSGNKPFIIEFDGQQHYTPINHFGGEEAFRRRKINDSIKNEYCKKNNILLLRISYQDSKKMKNIIQEFLKINEIKASYE